MEDAPTKQSQAAARILSKLANVSPDVTSILLSGTLPTMLTLFQTADTMAKRRGLLEVFVQLIKANIDVYGDWRSTGSAGASAPNNALIQFRDQALEVMLHGLESSPVSNVSYRLVCADGLLQLSKVRELLSEEDIGKIIQLLHAIVIHEESFGKDEVKESAINSLVEIAHQKPQVVIDKAFPAFMAQLPDTDEGPGSYVAVLEAFARLASEEKVFDTVILRLKNKFSAAVTQNASSSYLVALLSAMLYALMKGSSKLEQDPNTATYYEDIVLPLLKRTSSNDASRPKAFDDEATLDLVGRISNIIVRSQSAEQQEPIASELYTLFSGTPQAELPPFNTTASPNAHKSLIISTHLLASFRKETRLPCEIELLVSSLANYSQQPDLSIPVRSASLRQLSLAINKFYSTPALKTCLDPLMNTPFELFSPEKLDPPRIRVIFACLKGILLRSSPVLAKLYPQLLGFLSHPQYGTAIARGFSTLLQPDDLLTTENHCQISKLHKQKTFALLVPNITQAFREASPETKPNYLVALSGLLRWVPFSLVIEEVPTLITLLLQSLDLKGEDLVKEAAIDTLISTLGEKPELVQEHAGSLISRLLANSVVNKEAPTPPRVRAAACRCLMLVPEKLKLEVVLPYRRQVCRKLTAALDDGKREVRSAAVRCRAKWLDVDEAGDDD
jgi:DNA repair/transcription protein MET18/MMS19